MKAYLHNAACLLAAISMAACSTTRNIPEDELLYRGIRKVDFGEHATDRQDKTEEGVITAIADAYETVEGVLRGNADAMREADAKEAGDSIRKADRMDEENHELAKDEVQAVLAYAPNAALMGSSYVTHPLPVRLWIYNRYVNSKHKFGKWMFRQFATTPVYVSKVNPKVRSIVAQNTLRNYGYLHGKVSHDTVAVKNPRAAKISYSVQPGQLFHIDTIRYTGFPAAADSIIRSEMGSSALRQGQPFRVGDLDAERERIATSLRNRGFYYFRAGYITYRADTIMVQGKVQLQVMPSPTTPQGALRQYHIGNTSVKVLKYGEYAPTDSITVGRTLYSYSNGASHKPPLHLHAIQRYVLQRRGDTYSQRMEEISTELISSMGIFSSLRLDFTPRDTTASCDTLDMEVTAMLDKPYDTEFQGNVTSKSNGQVGPGVTFAMYKHNAFRGAETLGLKAWGSYEWQTGANLQGKKSLLNSYEYGISASLSYPRIMAFGLGRKYFRRTISSTDFAIDAKWMNRANYFGRVSLNASLTYRIQKRRNIRHEFTPISLGYDQLLNSTARFDSIVARNPALYVSIRDQFVPSMEYTYTWSARKHHPRTVKVNVKEAGAVTSAIYAIGGKGFTQPGKQLFDVPFAQFIKASAQYTHQFPLTKRSSIATRVFGGFVYSYGNATAAPLGDLFSVGGANSIRAFAIRSIGPGSYHPASSEYSYIDQMGDVKLEANVEYRFPIIANLYGAVFLDAGNVWLIRNGDTQPGGKLTLSGFGKEIALGTGAGIRYDLDFLVLRFDVGVGLHSPYDTGKGGYYNMPSFGKSLGYHFAIGYPF